jgi:imidazolonepropionase-like amidohydrolase
VIDGTGAPPVRDRAVVLEQRRIAAVVPDRQAGEGTVVDLGGLTLLPGLFIRAATSVAAAITGLEGETGRVAAGLAADLLAVEGNPAESLKALDAVKLVIADGRTVVRRL